MSSVVKAEVESRRGLQVKLVWEVSAAAWLEA